MSHWNYRVVRHAEAKEEWLEIHEVYYDDKGNPNGITDASAPWGRSLDTLKAIVKDLNKALKLPVLDYADLVKAKTAEDRAEKKRRKGLKL